MVNEYFQDEAMPDEVHISAWQDANRASLCYREVSPGGETLTKLLCTLLGHDRDRRRAWHDGLDWRAYCRRCDLPLIMDHQTQKWRPFDVRRDDSHFRKPPPGHEG